MKKKLFLLVIISLFVSCKQDKNSSDKFEITGTAAGIPNGVRVYLKSNEDPRNLKITDTAIIKDEKFFFTGSTKGPVSRGLYINSVRRSIPLIVEKGNITINVDKDDITKSTITGSKNNELLQEFAATRKLLNQKRIDLASEIRSIDHDIEKDRHEQLLNQLTKLNSEVENYTYTFIDKYPDSEVSLMALSYEIGKKNIDIGKFKKAFEQLKNITDRYPENKKIAQKISSYIDQRSAELNLQIGKTAPKFSAPDKDGNMMALDDLMGKVTIIDFWAAWCGPCRRENPNVVKVYEKYHDKGLEIIGVSLDGNRRQQDPKAAWLKAIEDDKLTWHHVSSLQYFNDPVARLYDVQSIPRTFILDEKGKIVAKNLRGQALEDKIAELLN